VCVCVCEQTSSEADVFSLFFVSTVCEMCL